MINRDDLEDVPNYGGPLERITAGVRNLWNAVNGLDQRADRQEKITDSLSQQVAELQKQLDALKADMRGVKISRGKQKAKADRAMAAIRQVEQDLDNSRKKLSKLQ